MYSESIAGIVGQVDAMMTLGFVDPFNGDTEVTRCICI
jgi:hypothetical protein